MITLHRTGQYRLYVNSGYTQEVPYICVRHQEHTAKFSLNPVSLQVNNGFSRTEINRIQQVVQDSRDLLLKHWANRSGDKVAPKVIPDLLLQD